MIPPPTPDQLKFFLTDSNPTVVFLASYIAQLSVTPHQPFLVASDALVALYEAASGVWLGDEDDALPDCR